MHVALAPRVTTTSHVGNAMRQMAIITRRRAWRVGEPSIPAHNAPLGEVALPPPPRRCASLHDDILLFSKQFCDTEEQEQARREAVDRTRHLLRRILPGADVHLFGSSTTGMRLPLSDTDIMIEATDADQSAGARKEVLGKLAAALRKEKMHRAMLEKDSILKWTDSESGVKFDACVNNVRGLRSTALLGRAAAESPAIAICSGE